MRKENKLLTVSSFFVILVFLAGYLFHTRGTLNPSDWIAFYSGILLTTINFILGLISLNIALKSDQKRFMGIVFGGMLFRMLLMLVVVYLALKFLQIRLNVFIFVIFVFYSFYLIIEIFYFYLLRERRY